MTDLKKDIEKKMKQSLDHLREEFGNLRTGRPNPSVLDPVLVEVYGSEMKIRDLANVTVAEGRQLLVTPFDPQTASSIGKGIEKANLGIRPIVDGNVIRIPIPEMTEDLRKSIAKEAKDKAEKTKVSIRGCRREANDLIKKQKAAGELSEDDQKKEEKNIQDLTDQFCKQIEELYQRKEKEILEV